MRVALCLLLIVTACRGGGLASSVSPAADSDAGSGLSNTADAATPDSPDASTDGGIVAAGGSDAGTPAPSTPVSVIPAAPCPGTPQILWSRTISNSQADFRGATDAEGNLYWTETDPPATISEPLPPAWLVSTDRDGQVRYRVTAPAASSSGAFMIVGGRVVVSKGVVLAAHDAATGAPIWSLDLTATAGLGTGDLTVGAADLGNGEIAFSVLNYTYGPSRVYLVDVTSGAVVWSSALLNNATVQGATGAGEFLLMADFTNIYGPPYKSAADFSVVDRSGRQTSTVHISDGRYGGMSLIAWPSGGVPWLPLADAQIITPKDGYIGTPPSWYAAVISGVGGFAFDWGANMRLTIHALLGGAVVADAVLSDFPTYDGVGTFPFLAGNGDHLVLIAQNYHSSPGLCHVETAGSASILRVDATAAYECPISFAGESAIRGAALLPDRLVLGRTNIITAACTNATIVFPVTIEAYSLPGESLATNGWVQSGGSPGLGMRPVTH